jgi:hypothetical protein
VPGEEVIAEAYDFPIPGYGTKTCSNMRLWDALAVKEFDLEAFNAGDYSQVGGCWGTGGRVGGAGLPPGIASLLLNSSPACTSQPHHSLPACLLLPHPSLPPSCKAALNKHSAVLCLIATNSPLTQRLGAPPCPPSPPCRLC